MLLNAFMMCFRHGRWEEEYAVRVDLQEKMAELEEVKYYVRLDLFNSSSLKFGQTNSNYVI